MTKVGRAAGVRGVRGKPSRGADERGCVTHSRCISQHEGPIRTTINSHDSRNCPDPIHLIPGPITAGEIDHIVVHYIQYW